VLPEVGPSQNGRLRGSASDYPDRTGERTVQPGGRARTMETTTMANRVSSGWLCERAIRAFDRLCALERSTNGRHVDLTPRQRHRRRLLETRARADEWLLPSQLAATVNELVATADRIDDPTLAMAWTDHLPVAVLSVMERRSLIRRLADHDALLNGAS
jgi:hypothetical protein